MEKQATSNSVLCPVCSLYLREGISLKNHLQTHSKEKVIEALLKQNPNDDNLDSIIDLTSNSTNQDSTLLSNLDCNILGLHRSSVGVVPTSSALIEPASNQVTRTVPSIQYTSCGVQSINNVQFPSTLSNSNNVIGQSNIANASNACTYYQFMTSDGNIVLIPVYNVGPAVYNVGPTSVSVPNNIVPSTVVNPCVIVPPNPVQSLSVVNPTTLTTDVFSSSVNSNDITQCPDARMNKSNSIIDSTIAHNNNINTSEDIENEDEKETDDEVATIFDHTLRKRYNAKKHPSKEEEEEEEEEEDDDDDDDDNNDDKSSYQSTTPSLYSLPDNDAEGNVDNEELEGLNKLIPSSAVSVIRVHSNLNFESDGSPFQIDDNDKIDSNSNTDCINSSTEEFSPVTLLAKNENVKNDSLSAQLDSMNESNRRDDHISSCDVDNKNAGISTSNLNEYDFVVSNSDNAMHILPDATDDSLAGMSRCDNDQYILPNDEIPRNYAVSTSNASDYNFLGIRNSFLSSVSLISSVNKTMFADVDVYNSVKSRPANEESSTELAKSTMKNEEFSVIVKTNGGGDGEDIAVETDPMIKISNDNVESIGSSRISPFNIQTDESMPARGELSGQESLSGNENSFWDLQMQQRSKNFGTTCDTYSEGLKIDLHSIISDINGSKDTLTLDHPNKSEEGYEFGIEKVASCSSSSNNDNKNKKKIVKREFICFYCRTKFNTWKERQSHIAEKHSEEDGLTIESLFGKRLKFKMETVKTEEGEEQQQQEEVDFKENPASPDLIICRICNESFNTSIDLLKHLKTFHGIRKRSCVCPTCFVRFSSNTEYQQHIQKVHPYECMTCGKKFYTRPGYMLHQKRHMKVKPYSCNDCDKSFVTKQKLAEHVNVHTGENPIKCELCDCQFKRYSNYQQHKKYLHLNQKRKLKDFVCACGEVFHSKVKLQWHQEIHDEKPKQCPFCVERFVHAASLTRHVRKWHNETYISEWVPKKKMKALVECPVCNISYLHSSLQTHMKIHQDVKPFACTECSRSFRTKWNLQLHKWTHMSRSAKPFKCKLCVKAYVHKMDYDAHIRSHNNCRPYACNVCGRQFIRKYNCIRHMREHKEPRAFKCNVCEKMFSRSYYLTEHEKVHTGEKPHVCHICGKASATKSNHNKHVKMHNVVRESVNSES